MIIQLYKVGMAIRNPTKFLDPKRIRIRNLNCGFGLLIFTTFVSFKLILG